MSEQATRDPWTPQLDDDGKPKKPQFTIPWSDEERRLVGLSNEQWVELRHGEDVTEAGRRNYKVAGLRASDPRASSVERSTALAQTDDYLIAMFVRSWSFGDPIPQADITKLAALPGRDYDLLVRCAGVLVSDAFPDFEPTPDVDSPFLGAGTAEVGAGGREGRRAEAVDAALADVPAGEAAQRVEQS